ncbi:OsmC/Ohr family [Xylogone sp. PMI_703]|nr:OsmC/Ohr family [Xylogone sp. PMI_703]
MLRSLGRRSVIRSFSSTSSNPAKIPFNISGNGSGVAQSIAVSGSPHTITVDAYPSFGGQDAAPSPLAYNLASLSACTQVTGSLVAKELGIKLGQWKVDVKGLLDTSVLVDGKEGNANWDSVELKVRVQTDAEDEAFKRFGSETDRRCPITQLFKRSGAQVRTQWVNEKSR